MQVAVAASTFAELLSGARSLDHLDDLPLLVERGRRPEYAEGTRSCRSWSRSPSPCCGSAGLRRASARCRTAWIVGPSAGTGFLLRGRPIYCTQFHPELDRAAMLERVIAYPEYIARIARISFDEFIQNVRETPEANSLLRRFVEHFLRNPSVVAGYSSAFSSTRRFPCRAAAFCDRDSSGGRRGSWRPG